MIRRNIRQVNGKPDFRSYGTATLYTLPFQFIFVILMVNMLHHGINVLFIYFFMFYFYLLEIEYFSCFTDAPTALDINTIFFFIIDMRISMIAMLVNM